jgi:hypothetical protein
MLLLTAHLSALDTKVWHSLPASEFTALIAESYREGCCSNWATRVFSNLDRLLSNQLSDVCIRVAEIGDPQTKETLIEKVHPVEFTPSRNLSSTLYHCAVDLDPHNVEAYYGLVVANIGSGDAEPWLQQWTRAEQNNGLPYYLLAFQEMTRSNLVQATFYMKSGNEAQTVAFRPLYAKPYILTDLLSRPEILKEAAAEFVVSSLFISSRVNALAKMYLTQTRGETAGCPVTHPGLVERMGERFACSEPSESARFIEGIIISRLAISEYLVNGGRDSGKFNKEVQKLLDLQNALKQLATEACQLGLSQEKNRIMLCERLAQISTSPQNHGN